MYSAFNFDTSEMTDNDYKLKKEQLIVTKNSISFKGKSCIRIPRSSEAGMQINDKDKTVMMYCNFEVFAIDMMEESTYSFDIATDKYLTIKYDKMEKDTSYFYFYNNMKTNIFKDNLSVNSVNNAYSTFNLLMTGKLNKIMNANYNDLPQKIQQIMNDNEIGGHSAVSYELLITELAKDSKDTTKPFRFKAVNTSSASQFTLINIREIPRNVSSFSAISAENITSGLTSSILNSKLGTVSQLSPLEAIALSKF